MCLAWIPGLGDLSVYTYGVHIRILGLYIHRYMGSTVQRRSERQGREITAREENRSLYATALKAGGTEYKPDSVR